MTFSFSFTDQVYGSGSINTINIESRKSGEDLTRSGLESSLSSPSCDEYLSAHSVNFHAKEARPAIDHQDSDESDTEIFRVKRRAKTVEKRNSNDVMSSKHSDHRVILFL